MSRKLLRTFGKTWFFSGFFLLNFKYSHPSDVGVYLDVERPHLLPGVLQVAAELVVVAAQVKGVGGQPHLAGVGEACIIGETRTG